jgi:hypothetical protein
MDLCVRFLSCHTPLERNRTQQCKRIKPKTGFEVFGFVFSGALQRGEPRTLGKARTALCATLLDWAKANENEIERIGRTLLQEQDDIAAARFAA